MILAQLAPDMVKGIPLWILGLGATVWLYNQLREAWDGLKAKEQSPPNSQLQIANEQMTKRLDSVENEVRTIKSELREDREKNEIHISSRSSSIYQKMDQTAAELRADMQRQSDHRETQIAELRSTIEALPERLLNMLKQIKDLGTK